jgi:hypothetical protein
VDATRPGRLPTVAFLVGFGSAVPLTGAISGRTHFRRFHVVSWGGGCRSRCVAPVGANSKRNRSGSRAVRSRSRSTIGGRAHDGRRSRIDKTAGAGSRSRETSSRPISERVMPVAASYEWRVIRTKQRVRRSEPDLSFQSARASSLNTWPVQRRCLPKAQY